MKKVLIYILLVLNITFLAGCWNYTEIENFAIVSALAVDKNPNEGYLILAETMEVNPSKSGISFTTNFIESKGETLLDAVRNLIGISGKRFFWSHAAIFIISQDIAREGILPVVDWIIRDPLPRPTLHIYISKETTAREPLNKEDKSTKILNFQFEETITALRNLGKSPHIEAYRLANQIYEDKFYSVLPTIEVVSNNKKSAVKITGSGFFREDKLEGFLDPIDTMKYLFIVNEIKGGVLMVDMGENNDKNIVTLEIRKNKTKLKTDYTNDEISMEVSLDTDVVIGEIEKSIDYTSKEGRQFLKEKTEQFVEGEIEAFIKKIQKEYGTDIFNFGDYIRKNDPNLWKKIEKDWDVIFRDLNVIVKSNINIKGSGHISKPIKVGD